MSGIVGSIVIGDNNMSGDTIAVGSGSIATGIAYDDWFTGSGGGVVGVATGYSTHIGTYTYPSTISSGYVTTKRNDDKIEELEQKIKDLEKKVEAMEATNEKILKMLLDSGNVSVYI